MVRTQAPLVERMTLVWHDWFATTKSGVPQKLMLRQNALLRRHALGNFEKLALDVTKDPAMLLWLNGTSNSRWDVNENYARELQELFCLGAGRGYSERDVRQLARALTGFRNDWTDAGPTRFRFDKKFHDRGAKRIYGRRGKYGWQEAVRLVTRHRRHPEFMVTKLWGYFIPTSRRRRRPRSWRGCTSRSDRDVRPLLEAILTHPDLYDPAKRMVKPPVVQVAGMLRAVGRGIDTPAWAWLCDSAGQYLFMPPNVSGWDDTAGWTRRRSARAGRSPSTSANRRGSIGETGDTAPSDPAELVNRAAAFWGSPKLSAPGARRPGALRRRHDGRRRQALEGVELSGARGERAADADRHLPGLPDELMKNTCCTEHARASAGLPAIEAGMPEPAGTGLSRRSFLLRSAGLGLAVYGAGRIAQLPAFEAGVAHAQAAPRRDGAAERVPGRRRRQSEPAGAGRGPDLPAPAADARDSARARVRRGLPPRLASGGIALWPTCTPRARSPSCPRSATPTPTSRTSPRATSGRSARSIRTCARAGSGACSTASARPTTRSRASLWTASSRPSLATARNPVAAVDKPEDVGFWTPGAWGPAEELAVPAFTGIGRSLLGSGDPAVAQAARAAAFAGGVRDALAPLGIDGKPAYMPAAAYPQDKDPFPRRLAGFAAMLAAGLPIRAAAIRAPGRLGHARQSGRRAAEEPEADVRLAARLPARHRGARARRSRAHARLVGVRAPRGRERLGHRPRGGRRRLPRRHAGRPAG